MNLEERIKKGMIFYETGHKSIENKEIEERLDRERRHCKEKMFDYNHCRPDDQKTRQKILKELLGSCGEHVFIEDGLHTALLVRTLEQKLYLYSHKTSQTLCFLI